jgi:hypothetical protein
MQDGTGAGMAADRLGERREQELGLPDPVGECGAVKLNAFAGVDTRLPVQWLVVAELRDHHVSDQARAWPPALDRQRRHGCLHDGLAGTAAQLRADMSDHLEAGRDVFEHLALVRADPAEGGAAAAGAGAGRLVDDGLARQMRRQRRAHRLAARTRMDRLGGVAAGGGVGRPGARLVCRDVFFEFTDQQFELLDLMVKLFGGTAEPGSP